MTTKLDWIAFTLPVAMPVLFDRAGDYTYISNEARNLFPHAFDWLSNFTDMKLVGANKIFEYNFRSSTGQFSISQTSRRPLCRIEVSGQGMDLLYEHKILHRWIKNYADRMTRIDIAIDWHTNITPKELAMSREGSRFTHYVDHHQDTGDTYYIGSYKSERFAYVYRYNEPHPRSHLLRCEFRNKGDYAKSLAEALQTEKVSTLANGLLQTYGITNILGIPLKAGKSVTVTGHTSSLASTERWLFKQVLPACRKLLENGNIENVELFSKVLREMVDKYAIERDNELHRLEQRNG